jgi:hypothetical protein
MVAKVEHAVKSDLVWVVLSLVKITLMMLLIMHWIACVWWVVGTHSFEALGTDVPRWPDGFQLKTLSERYVICAYFVVTTMCTIGYGDITAKNHYERVYSIFIEVLGAAGFAILSGSLCSIILTLDEHNALFRARLKSATRYMAHHDLDGQLQMRVRQYLGHLFDNAVSSQAKEDLMKLLSTNLQMEVGFRKKI